MRVLAEAQSAIVVAQADVLVKALFPPLAVQGEGAADAWRACHGALVALEKALPRESLPQLVQPCRTAVSDAVERTRRHLRQQGGAAVMAAEVCELDHVVWCVVYLYVWSLQSLYY